MLQVHSSFAGVYQVTVTVAAAAGLLSIVASACITTFAGPRPGGLDGKVVHWTVGTVSGVLETGEHLELSELLRLVLCQGRDIPLSSTCNVSAWLPTNISAN